MIENKVIESLIDEFQVSLVRARHILTLIQVEYKRELELRDEKIKSLDFPTENEPL